MIVDSGGTGGEMYSKVEEVWYDGRSLVCWEKCGILREVWYDGRSVVCWEKFGMLEEVRYDCRLVWYCWNV